MENNKKRRNSILKKKTTEDDTTTDIKARRISFSGKKSVKEFIAGDEAVTIWGTSYEESADDLQQNSTESGLVNVHQKRIVLRNRKVVFDSSTSKRKLKKKISIGENDKENVFIEPKPVEEVPSTSNKCEENVSPNKTELALLKIDCEDVKNQIMSQIPDRASICSSTFDFINFSAPINKSIYIEHSVDITLSEHEMQMFKFRAPVTSTDITNLSVDNKNDGTSPNLLSRSIQICEEDLNILKMMRDKQSSLSSRKTLLTEKEAKEFERIKLGVVPKGSQTQITFENNNMNNEVPLKTSDFLSDSNVIALKGCKRKSEDISKSISQAKDSSFMDLNSPIRKKPLHDATTMPMEITQAATISENEVINPAYNQTNKESFINKNNVTMEQSIAPPKFIRKTIYFKNNQIDEDTICQSKSDSKKSNHNDSMELSICVTDGNDLSPKTHSKTKLFEESGLQLVISSPNVEYNQQRCLKNRKTIHFEEHAMETSVKFSKEVKSVYADTDMSFDSSMVDQPSTDLKINNRRTLYDTEDIAKEAIENVQESTSLTKNIVRKRESIYSPSDMIEDYPQATKPQTQGTTPHHNKTSNGPSKEKVRQSILYPIDIETDDCPHRETELIEDYPQATKPQTQGITPHHNKTSNDPSKEKVRQSILFPIDIETDDCPHRETEQKLKDRNQLRKSNFTAIDIVEDSPKQERQRLDFAPNLHKSVYTSADMTIDPESSDYIKKWSRHDIKVKNSSRETIKPQVNNRKTIYTHEQIVIEPSNSTQSVFSNDIQKRKTVHLQEDISVDESGLNEETQDNQNKKFYSAGYSTADIEQSGYEVSKQPGDMDRTKLKNDLKQRQSTYIPVDIVEDSPRPNEPKNQSIFSHHNERFNESSNETTNSKQRRSICSPIDIELDSPDCSHSQTLTAELNENKNQIRKTIYTAEGIIEDSPKLLKETLSTKHSVLQRKLVYSTPDLTIDAEIFENLQESAVKTTNSSEGTKHSGSINRKTQYQSICSPIDVELDTPDGSHHQLRQSFTAEFQYPTDKLWKSIYTAEGIEEDSPKQHQEILATKSSILQRKSVYLPADMTIDSDASKCVQKLDVMTPNSLVETEKVQLINRKTQYRSICNPIEVELASPDCSHSQTRQILAAKLHDPKEKIRKSIYTVENIIEDSPQQLKETIITKPSILQLKSVYQSADMTVDSDAFENIPKTDVNTTNSLQNTKQSRVVNKEMFTLCQPTCVPRDIEPNSPDCSSKQSRQNLIADLHDPKKKSRESIYTVEDITEDSPKQLKEILQGKSVYISADMTIDPETSENIEKLNVKVANCPRHTKQSGLISRKTIYTHDDIAIEPSKTNQRKTIHSQRDISIDESAVPHRQSADLQATIQHNKHIETAEVYNTKDTSGVDIDSVRLDKQNINHHVRIRTDSSDLNFFDKSPHKRNSKQRQSTYIPVDIVEESPKQLKHCSSTTQQQQTNIDSNKETNVENISKSVPRSEGLGSINNSKIFNTQSSSQNSNDLERKTNKVNNPILIKAIQNQQLEKSILPHNSSRSKRQTIFFNEDLDIEDFQEGHTSFQPQSLKTSSQYPKEKQHSPQKSDRKTIYFSNNNEIDSTRKEERSISMPTNRTTSNFIQSPQGERSLSIPTNRPTSNFTQSTQEEHVLSSRCNRQTIFFNQAVEIDNIKDKMEDSTCQKQENTKGTFQSNQDIVYNQNFKEIIQPQIESTVTKDEVNPKNATKTFPKPRRVTIYDEQAIDIDEDDTIPKCTARKSSFNRALDFNGIKTEASNIQSPALNHIDMDIDEPQQEKSVQLKPRVSWHPGITNEESPIYNENVCSKLPQTPSSEIDRSMAEYLKYEALTLKTPVKETTRVQMQANRRYNTSEIPEESFHSNFLKPSNKAEKAQMDISIQSATEINTQKNGYTLQSPRKTLFEPKSMIEDSMITESPVKNISPKVRTPRKTIHFTSENAVDESFFDENQSKILKYQSSNRKRKTIVFNDSENCMDESSTLGATRFQSQSKAVQSVKKLLEENSRLFNAANLLKPFNFHSKKSFAGKENIEITTPTKTINCESQRTNKEVEVTPPNNKSGTSRIPKLINSANKLESIKKTMELIQQELPKLGNQLHSQNQSNLEQSYEKNEKPTLKTVSKVSKNLQESFQTHDIPKKQFEECFDTIEIPRRATFTVRKNSEETDKDDDIPRRVTSFETRKSPPKEAILLEESRDAFEIPRRLTTFQRDDTLYINPTEMETTNGWQKSGFQLEDAPITISDVSTYFTQKRLTTNQEANFEQVMTTDVPCILELNRLTMDNQLPKSSDSEDTTHNYGNFQKRYIELTCDSIMLSPREEIEKTHLSLVNTLDEVVEECHQQECLQLEKSQQQKEVQLKEVDHQEVEHQQQHNEDIPSIKPLKPLSSVCRKCKQHRLSLTHNNTTVESFVLEPLPIYEMNLAKLQELGKKPKISEVGKFWRQKMRESDSFYISDGSRSIALDDDDESIDKFLVELQKMREIFQQQRKPREVTIETTFIDRVQEGSESTNWMINDLLLINNILHFTHDRLRTFAITISFTPKDPRGIKVNFDEMKIVPNVHANWTPYDYALHYQLMVELPFDLKQICPNSEGIFDMLEHVEKVTQDVIQTGKEMLKLILTSPASLIRETGTVYIRKYARRKTAQNEVKRVEILIEVLNMKKLSYKSIALPPLYEFDEKIQLLPVGQDFLKVFLADPLQYLKT